MGCVDGVRVGRSGGDPVVDPGAGHGDNSGRVAMLAGTLAVGDAEWAW